MIERNLLNANYDQIDIGNHLRIFNKFFNEVSKTSFYDTVIIMLSKYNFGCNLNLEFYLNNKRISTLCIQDYHSHLAKALSSKYPEVGLPSPKGPTILDPNLKAEVVFRGLKYPTSMAFLGPNDILVTEKDAGTVRRIVNGTESTATFA